MVENLINKSRNENSGFYLNEDEKLVEKLRQLSVNGCKTILIGVSYALLDLAEKYSLGIE